MHNIRATDSYIRGSNGTSNGIVPMLRVYNDTARYVDQGGGKRKGSFAIYLEPWHADIETFLDLKKNHGNELERARDLFYGLWIPDLFMRRVEANEQWSLMCPNECPGLADCHGKEFEELYEKYEKEGRARKQIPAQQLWFAILDSQVETGTPYMLYKDACNGKSNQKHLGASRRPVNRKIKHPRPRDKETSRLDGVGPPRDRISTQARSSRRICARRSWNTRRPTKSRFVIWPRSTSRPWSLMISSTSSNYVKLPMWLPET